ncbi:hypothetical protein BT69DRAFT_1306207 [Atractiella rhizophila]|nr:hypothetical protein BT69DRAFT_1306207 [Atractiella rhizophila]
MDHPLSPPPLPADDGETSSPALQQLQRTPKIDFSPSLEYRRLRPSLGILQDGRSRSADLRYARLASYVYDPDGGGEELKRWKEWIRRGESEEHKGFFGFKRKKKLDSSGEGVGSRTNLEPEKEHPLKETENKKMKISHQLEGFDVDETVRENRSLNKKGFRDARWYKITVVFIISSLYMPLSKISISALLWSSDFWAVSNPYLDSDFPRSHNIFFDNFNWAPFILIISAINILVVTIWLPLRLWGVIKEVAPKVDKFSELGDKRTAEERKREYERIVDDDEGEFNFLYNYSRPFIYSMAIKLTTVVILTNNSDWVSRVGYVVIALIGLFVAIKSPPASALNGPVLLVATIIVYILNGYFSLIHTGFAQQAVKRLQKQLDFSIDLLSPHLDLAEHVTRRIWQETFSTIMMVTNALQQSSCCSRTPDAEEQQAVFSECTKANPYLLGFEGTQGERHAENVRILREIGYEDYMRGIEKNRIMEDKYRDLWTTIVMEFSGPDCYRKSSYSLQVQTSYRTGGLRIEHNADLNWRGYNFCSGFSVTIDYRDGQGRSPDGGLQQGKELKLDAPGLGISDDFSVSPTLAKLLQENKEAIDQGLGALQNILFEHRKYFHDLATWKRRVLSYYFLMDISANAGLSPAQIRQVVERNEQATKTRNLPSWYYGSMAVLQERLSAVNRLTISQFWYILWDDLWRRNGNDVPSIGKHPSQFSPYYRSSICYHPLSRPDLEAFLRNLGLWINDGRCGYFTTGFLNRIYLFLDQIVFEDASAQIPIKVGSEHSQVPFSDLNRHLPRQIHEEGTHPKHVRAANHSDTTQFTCDTGAGTDHDDRNI